jgi:hypothetical protein
VPEEHALAQRRRAGAEGEAQGERRIGVVDLVHPLRHQAQKGLVHALAERRPRRAVRHGLRVAAGAVDDLAQHGPVVARRPQHQREVRLGDGGDARARPARGVQRVPRQGQRVVDVAGVHGVQQQVVLAGEARVEAADGHARAAGHLLHGHVLEARHVQQLAERAKDALFGLPAARLARRAGRCGR